MRDAICVVGMHRSGTSMIARCLAEIGVDFGSEFIPPQTDNPDGFWEAPFFVDLNDKLLSEHGAGWDTILFPTAKQLQCTLKTWQESIAEYVATHYDGSWGFKDPRTTRLISFWDMALRNIGYNCRYVLCIRGPKSVAESLFSRNGLDERHSLLLWLSYNYAAVLTLFDRDCIVVDYDTVIEDPAGEMSRLAQWVGMPMTDGELQHVVSLVKGGLRHHDNYCNDTLLHTVTNEMYELCRVATADNRGINSNIVRDLANIFSQVSEALNTDISRCTGLIDKAASQWSGLQGRFEETLNMMEVVRVRETQFEGENLAVMRLAAETTVKLIEMESEIVMARRELELIKGSRTWRISEFSRRLWYGIAGKRRSTR